MLHGMVLIWTALVVGDVRDYVRPLDAKKLDQATLDAESFGEKKTLKREDNGLRITLAPGQPESGWKTPQVVKIGGDFTISARFLIHKLPKPAQEDGVAVGISIASQNLDQPDATFLRLTEMNDTSVYRSIDKPVLDPQMQMQLQMQRQMMMFNGGPAAPVKPEKPPRKTFPAKGLEFTLELRREGTTVRYYVLDAASDAPRYLGQVELGSNDIAGVKLFAANRNGAEAVDVTLRDLAIHANRVNGLGTEVRTVFGEIVHGDPTSLEEGKLIIGGTPKAPKPPEPKEGAKPAAAVAEPPKFLNVNAFQEPVAPAPAAAPNEAKPAAPATEATPAPAPAAAPAVAAPAGAVLVAPAGAVVMVAPAAPGGAVLSGAVTMPVAPNGPPGTAPNEAKPGGAAPAKAEPKAKLPLSHLETIAFERADMMTGRFQGQPNLDFTMPIAPKPKDATAGGETKPAEKDKPKDAAATDKPADKPNADDLTAPPPGTVAVAKIPKVDPKPNGIRDLYVTLSNLRSSPITQVMVTTQTDKGPASWRLDTSNSQDWPLVLRRAGTESWADLFLEPPDGDLNGKSLTVNVTYADGQSANANINVTQKTDPKLAFDPKAPAPSLDARVYLTGGEQLFGRFESLGAETLKLRTPWGDDLAVPLARVTGIYMGLPEHKESAESFAKRLRARGAEDLLLATAKNGEVVAISGIAEGTDGDRLRFHFQEKTRSLPLKQVEGLILAARPDPEQAQGVRSTFSLSGGLVISGLWKDLDTETWKVETPWGQELKLPAPEVRSVRFRGGEMTYLSDLEPSKVEQTPFFGRLNPWRKDVNLAGGPLKMDGRTYEHGIAVHSRTALTYDLDGQYSTFEATVGFDEAAKKAGRVDCRVFADDKEIYANPDLRADGKPVKLALPVTKARKLKLLVDFGANQDTGDRVIWANARLFRSPPASTASAAEPKPVPPEEAKTPTTKPGSGE